MSTETHGRAEILRAAGHADAADLLDAIDRANAKDEADQQPQAPEPQRQSTDAEAQRRAEGEAMMAALRESIPNIYDR
jgi:hypothetical protein